MTTVTFNGCRCLVRMIKTRQFSLQKMVHLANLDNPRRKTTGALVVLLAVCSIAVSVATRYCSPQYSSITRTHVVHKHCSSEPGRQRLTKSTANWLPPVGQTAILQSPTVYTPLSSVGPSATTRFLDQSLANRPPPSSDLLS